MKTAMQEFIKHLFKIGIKPNAEIRNEFLKKEKQQIIDAVLYGNREEFYDATEQMGECYYNQTFK